MRLANVRIAHKLVLGFACILAIFAAAAGAIFSALAHVESAEAANTAAHAVLIDLEQLSAARYDQSQTARGFIITRVERHANLYAAATKLFDETLAKTQNDAGTAPDSTVALDAIAKLAAAASGWQKEVGDPEVLLARDPATLDQAVDVAKSPKSSAHMQEFREALDKARAIVDASLKSSQASQAAAVAFAKNAQLAGGLRRDLLFAAGRLGPLSRDRQADRRHDGHHEKTGGRRNRSRRAGPGTGRRIGHDGRRRGKFQERGDRETRARRRGRGGAAPDRRRARGPRNAASRTTRPVGTGGRAARRRARQTGGQGPDLPDVGEYSRRLSQAAAGFQSLRSRSSKRRCRRQPEERMRSSRARARSRRRPTICRAAPSSRRRASRRRPRRWTRSPRR